MGAERVKRLRLNVRKTSIFLSFLVQFLGEVEGPTGDMIKEYRTPAASALMLCDS